MLSTHSANLFCISVRCDAHRRNDHSLNLVSADGLRPLRYSPNNGNPVNQSALLPRIIIQEADRLVVKMRIPATFRDHDIPAIPKNKSRG